MELKENLNKRMNFYKNKGICTDILSNPEESFPLFIGSATKDDLEAAIELLKLQKVTNQKKIILCNEALKKLISKEKRQD